MCREVCSAAPVVLRRPCCRPATLAVALPPMPTPSLCCAPPPLLRSAAPVALRRPFTPPRCHSATLAAPPLPSVISGRALLCPHPLPAPRSGCFSDRSAADSSRGCRNCSIRRSARERPPKAVLDKINIRLDKIEVDLAGFENQFFNSRGHSAGLWVHLYTVKQPKTKT